MMTEEVYEIEPQFDTQKDKKSQRMIIWSLVGAFIFINIFIIVIGTFSTNLSMNISNIIDIIFWFDISTAGIIGSYFGVDIVSNLVKTQTITMRKIS